MEIQVTDGGSLAVADRVFGVEFNEALVHQVVVAYLAGARAGTKAQKNRSAVSGGGRKPFRQKGTGRARAGTIRSPLWRGGGRAFAAAPQDWSQKVNRKQYRAAMRAILAELARQDRLVVVQRIGIDAPRTQLAKAQLQTLGVTRGLLVDVDVEASIYLATRNIPHVYVCDARGLDPVSLVGADKVVITEQAVRFVEEWLQ